MTRLSRTLRIAAAGLMLFITGYLLLHGRVAQEAGSWRYTITHDDEYAFWVIADGFGESPRSDANPFYTEHSGRTNSILSYPTVALVGALSGWLEVPALTFLPIWKVGAPFLTWLGIWLCLTHIWGIREGPAACGSPVPSTPVSYVAEWRGQPVVALPSSYWCPLFTQSSVRLRHGPPGSAIGGFDRTPTPGVCSDWLWRRPPPACCRCSPFYGRRRAIAG